MIPQIQIKHDLDRLAREFSLLATERVAAAANAINKTMVTVRAEASRSLANDYRGLKIGAIKSRIKLFPKANRSSLRSTLTFSNKRIRLFNWQLGRIQTKYGTGVRASGRLPAQILRVDAVSGRVTQISAAELSHAFIARDRRTRNPNIWLRQGKHSVPIDVLLTPSLSETLVNRRLDQALGRRARERFQQVFAQEAKRKLGKR